MAKVLNRTKASAAQHLFNSTKNEHIYHLWASSNTNKSQSTMLLHSFRMVAAATAADDDDHYHHQNHGFFCQ